MPRIIDKKFDALMDEELRLADNYTPEWKPSQDDPGLALLKIFTHMREEIISRLNRVPDKNLTAFFDMIGVKLLLPLSAKVPVTFYPTEGTFNSVFVPRGTEVAAPKNDNHETLTYQTMAGFSATKASIIEILSVGLENDAIYSHKDDLNKNTIKLFEEKNPQKPELNPDQSEEKNLQKHVLYLGHIQLFDIKPSGEITLAFKLANSDGFDLSKLKWRYWDGVDWVETKIPVQKSDGNSLKITLIIGKDKDGKLRAIKEREINNINSMWISCSLDDDQKESAFPHAEVERVSNEASNQSTDLYTLSFQEIWIDKVTTDSESTTTDSPRSPDLIAYNFNPLDPRANIENIKKNKKLVYIYPFGRQPRLYDSFYISSRDAFSKKNASISVKFKAMGNPDDKPEVRPSDELTLALEYWNGTFWNILNYAKDKLNEFKRQKGSDYEGSFTFVCPEDIQETDVNGARNYWIRIRITAGDYGAEQLVDVDKLNEIGKKLEKASEDPNLKPDSTKELLLQSKNNLSDYCNEFKSKFFPLKSEFFPPWITAIDISYSLENRPDKEKYHLESCIAYNNLEYIDFTADSRGDKDGGSHDGFFRPFIPLFDDHPTVYLGFDSSLGNGNVSIFFSVPEENRSVPDLKWHCWCAAPGIIESKGCELTLESTDGLCSQTELLLEKHFDGGTIRENAVVSEIHEKNVVKLVKSLSHAFTRSSRILKKVSLDVLDGTDGLARSDSLVFTDPPDHLSTTHFGKCCTYIMGIWAKEKPEGISISSIFPNTAWAEQVETISDEIIGSSDGEKGQEFRFVRSPVISPQLWVRESSNVAEDDRQFIQPDGLKTSEVMDELGKITDVWVLWKAVEDFYDSGPRSRHYMVDEALGRIYFGDGTRGMIPPIGTDNLRASYNTGGGLPGNISAGEINTIKTPISGIDKIYNPLPADGGSDIEDLGSALERGPLIIKSLGRAVTEEDYESLAKESSSYIARTKCFTEGDGIKVVVIPKSNVEMPTPSPRLLRVVREYLAKKMPATLHPKKFEVMGPIYKEIRISATVVPRFRDDSVVLERMIIIKLKEYLHPLWGGRDKSGWPFGRSIHISELYELLESIDGVDYVDDLRINRSDRHGEFSEATIDIGKMEMVCSGEHSITMKGGAEK